MDNFIDSYQSQNQSSLENYWGREVNQIQVNGNYFTYDSAYTAFLIDIQNSLPNSVSGAYNYIVKSNTNLNDRNNFIGSVLAYEFDSKDKTVLTERRKRGNCFI